MLFQKLGKMKRIWIMTSIIMIIVALVMLICPVDYIGVLISVLGYVMLIGAAVMTFNFLSSHKGLVNYIILAGGLLMGLLGLIILIERNNILPVLSLLFGLVLLLEGVNDLINAFIYVRRAGMGAWVFLAILSVLSIGCGVILLINPWWNHPAVLMQMIGFMLLYSSVVKIIRVILTWPFKNV